MTRTVKSANEMPVPMDSVELVGGSIVEKMSALVRKVRREVDLESQGFSVSKFGRKKLGGFVHSQVARVKEEELLLREDVDADAKKSGCHQERGANVVVFARPILPCSPLSGNSANIHNLKAASL